MAPLQSGDSGTATAGKADVGQFVERYVQQLTWGGRIGVIGDDPGGGVSRSVVWREAGRGRSGRRLVGSAEHHAGPVRDECLGRGKPKAAAAAGHQVDPVARSQTHAAILPWRAGRARSRRSAIAQFRDRLVRGRAANRNGVAPCRAVLVGPTNEPERTKTLRG